MRARLRPGHIHPREVLTSDKRVNSAAGEVGEAEAGNGRFASARAVNRANYLVDSRTVGLTIGSIPELGGRDD